MTLSLAALTLSAALAAAPLSSSQLDLETEALAQKIRCPVCQGSSIADSPSTMATDMRREVHELLASGMTEEQILTRFEHAYGQQIRLDPKPEGATRLLFWAPALLIIIGVALAWRLLRKEEST